MMKPQLIRSININTRFGFRGRDETQPERREVRENRWSGSLNSLLHTKEQSVLLTKRKSEEKRKFEYTRGSLLLDVDDAWKSQVSMLTCSEPSFHSATTAAKTTADSQFTHFEWKKLFQQQQASKTNLLSNHYQHGCSLVFVIFLLLQLEIFFIPLAAALSVRNTERYLMINDNGQKEKQAWKRSINLLLNNQSNKINKDNGSGSGHRGDGGNISNATLFQNEFILDDEWKRIEEKDETSDDQQSKYQSAQFILFTFTAVRNNDRMELFTTASAQYHIIELEPEEKLTINCQASLLGLGDDMDVMWWKDNEFLSTGNSSLTISDDQSLGLYRCVADVAIVSTDLLDSYLMSNRVKRSAEMPPGKVLSNAVIVQRIIPLHFIVHPVNTTVTNGSVIRLECATNGSQSQSIVWLRNGTVIEENNSDNIHIYTIEHQSVLHLLGAQINDSGEYGCQSGTVFSDIALVTVTLVEDTNLEKSSKVLKEPSSELSVPIGGSIIVECLVDDLQSSTSWHAVNEYGQPIKKYETKDDGESHSAMVIRASNTQDNGKYSCSVMGKTIQQTISTFITVQVPPVLVVERSVKRITGTLGTTARLRCSASVEPHDASFEINWYKDGKKVVSFGRAKMQWKNNYFDLNSAVTNVASPGDQLSDIMEKTNDKAAPQLAISGEQLLCHLYTRTCCRLVVAVAASAGGSGHPLFVIAKIYSLLPVTLILLGKL